MMWRLIIALWIWDEYFTQQILITDTVFFPILFNNLTTLKKTHKLSNCTVYKK